MIGIIVESPDYSLVSDDVAGSNDEEVPRNLATLTRTDRWRVVDVNRSEKSETDRLVAAIYTRTFERLL